MQLFYIHNLQRRQTVLGDGVINSTSHFYDLQAMEVFQVFTVQPAEQQNE